VSPLIKNSTILHEFWGHSLLSCSTLWSWPLHIRGSPPSHSSDPLMHVKYIHDLCSLLGHILMYLIVY
jgi:hypothetical protein